MELRSGVGGTGVDGTGERPTGDTVSILSTELVDIKLDILFGLASVRPAGVRGELLELTRSKKPGRTAGLCTRWLKRSGELEVEGEASSDAIVCHVSSLKLRGESAVVDFFDLRPNAPRRPFFCFTPSPFCCRTEEGEFEWLLVRSLEIGIRLVRRSLCLPLLLLPRALPTRIELMSVSSDGLVRGVDGILSALVADAPLLLVSGLCTQHIGLATYCCRHRRR